MHQPALPTAHTEVPSDAHGPELLGLDAEGWVYVGLTIFLLIAIFVAKAPKRVTDILDQRIADTRRSLDEAKAVRDEAEALLADAKAQQAAAQSDAAAIRAQAEHEADQLRQKAQEDAELLIAHRARMAEDKIAAAERTAIADVRARAASVAVAAAEKIIGERHDADADKALVQRTISGMAGARLN